MDRKNSNIITEISMLGKDIEDLKDTQPIAGDGWICYRDMFSFNLLSSNTYELSYVVPESQTGVVVTLYGGNTGSFTGSQLLPARLNEPSTWLFKPDSDGSYDFFVYSTHDGNLISSVV